MDIRSKQEKVMAVALLILDLMTEEKLDEYDKLTVLTVAQKLLGVGIYVGVASEVNENELSAKQK